MGTWAPRRRECRGDKMGEKRRKCRGGKSLKSQVVRQLMRQLVYTMFISNNRTSFHLWRKENFLKHQKVKILKHQNIMKVVVEILNIE